MSPRGQGGKPVCRFPRGSGIQGKQSTDTHLWLFSPIGVLTTFVVGYVASLLLPPPPGALDGLTIYGKPRSGAY